MVKEVVKMGVPGRPRIFDTPEEMQEAIDNYFDEITTVKTNKQGEEYIAYVRPPTVTGLAYHLGTTRKTLLDYQNHYEDGFRNTITRAKTKIEMYAEEQLYRGQGKTNGIQFNLKNNFGWKDKHEHDLNHSGGVTIVDDIE